jgi:hypothetical protein
MNTYYADLKKKRSNSATVNLHIQYKKQRAGIWQRRENADRERKRSARRMYKVFGRVVHQRVSPAFEKWIEFRNASRVAEEEEEELAKLGGEWTHKFYGSMASQMLRKIDGQLCEIRSPMRPTVLMRTSEPEKRRARTHQEACMEDARLPEFPSPAACLTVEGAHNALNFFEEARKMLKSQEQMMIGRIRVAEMQRKAAARMAHVAAIERAANESA